MKNVSRLVWEWKMHFTDQSEGFHNAEVNMDTLTCYGYYKIINETNMKVTSDIEET